jgi:hypothetical protein
MPTEFEDPFRALAVIDHTTFRFIVFLQINFNWLKYN